MEGTETGFLPYKKAFFFFPGRQRRQTAIQPSLLNPGGLAWERLNHPCKPGHRGAVALARAGSHIVTSFLAPLDQAQPSVQEPQQPLDSIDHALFQSKEGFAGALLRLQRPGALERRDPGKTGFIVESGAKRGVVFAWRRYGEGRNERQEEGRDEEPGREGNYKTFALVVNPAGDELPPLLF